MEFHIIKAQYLKDFVIRIYFQDGSQGEIDFAHEFDGEIYEPLQNIHYFKQFQLKGNTLFWENGADFAPEYLYKKINASIKIGR